MWEELHAISGALVHAVGRTLDFAIPHPWFEQLTTGSQSTVCGEFGESAASWRDGHHLCLLRCWRDARNGRCAVAAAPISRHAGVARITARAGPALRRDLEHPGDDEERRARRTAREGRHRGSFRG